MVRHPDAPATSLRRPDIADFAGPARERLLLDPTFTRAALGVTLAMFALGVVILKASDPDDWGIKALGGVALGSLAASFSVAAYAEAEQLRGGRTERTGRLSRRLAGALLPLACFAIGLLIYDRTDLVIDNGTERPVTVEVDGRSLVLDPGALSPVMTRLPGSCRIVVRTTDGDRIETATQRLSGGWSYVYNVEGASTYALRTVYYHLPFAKGGAPLERILEGRGFLRFHADFPLDERAPFISDKHEQIEIIRRR
jgi:hypothetical protein